MAKSSIFEGFTSPAKGRAKKVMVMKRYGRRQLLKKKAGKGLIPKNPIGAEIREEAEAEEEEEEEGEEEEMEEEGADEKKLSTGSDADSEDVHNTSALQPLADQPTVGAANQVSGIQETGEGSTMGQTTVDFDLAGLVGSFDDDEETKESESLATPEDDMYYIEAIKSSRIGKDGRLEFLIKWEGYEKKSDLTWEPEKTLVDSASETLSEYFEKIGGREAIGAKRKRSRPSKTTGTDISEKLPNAKKQKLNSQPVIEKVKIIWNEGECPTAGAAKEDKNGTREDDGEETVPKTLAPKKGRGRPPKNKALETSQKGNDAFKNAPGIAPAQAESARLSQASKPKNDEPMSKVEQENKMENLKGLKTQSDRRAFMPVDERGERIVSHSGNDITKEGPGRPPKALGQVALSADQVPPGKDTAKKELGRPPKSASHLSSPEKSTTLDESIAKKGRGRPPKSKQPDIALADEGLAGSVAKKPQGRSPKNVGSTPSSSAKNTLEGTAVKRGRGRPSKIKESHNIEKESKKDRGDRESSALG